MNRRSELLDPSRVDTAPITLVSPGGVRESIADDPFAARQRRPNQVFDVDAASGKHQERLRPWRDILGTPFEDDFPHALSQRRSAWLTGHARGDSPGCEQFAGGLRDC